VLWHRVLTAAVGIPLTLLVIYLGGWFLAGFVTVLAILGLREYYGLSSASGDRVQPALGYLLVLPITLTPAPYTMVPMLLVVCVWALGELALMLRYLICMKALADIGDAGWRNATLLGLLYLPFLLGHMNLLRAIPGDDVSLPAGISTAIPLGAGLLALVVAACWSSDTAAYFVGRAAGRHKLWPRISPGKTIEGAAGGLVAAVALTAILGNWLGLPLAHSLVLGAILGLVGQLGDLFESSLKRRAGAKDSGALLPGHGGVLDRFDSLLFCAPAAYYYLRCAVGL
jgi:phosphatidate cytidylyltransferase